MLYFFNWTIINFHLPEYFHSLLRQDRPFALQVGWAVFLPTIKVELTGNEVVSNKSPVPVLAIKQEAPEYPKHAALSCTNGHVQLEFIILTDGSVKDIVVIKANPAGVFEAEAITAVSKWRFKPIVEEQKVSQRLEFKFNMNKCNKLLIRQSQFDFTDGISKDEALYMAQNYCIQTHTNT